MKKNKLWIVWAILLLLIPTYIGVYSLLRTAKTPISPNSAKFLRVTDLEGRVFEKEPTDRVAALFAQIETRATPVETPAALAGTASFAVTYHTASRESLYQYYFSMNTDTVYYEATDTGLWYHVNEEDAKAFLLTDCAQCLYAESAVPALTLGGTEVAPRTYNWAYVGVDGSALAGDRSAKETGDLLHYPAGTLELLYERAPETLTLHVQDTAGTTLYTGAYDALGDAIDLQKYETLQVDATASWLADDAHPSGGTADYSFYLEVTAPPAFRLSNKLSDAAQKGDGKFYLEPGDLLTVFATGIEDVEKITFTSTPALTHGGAEITPVFFAAGNRTACAYLPTAYDTAAGEYTVTFGYAGTTVLTATLSVANVKFRTQYYPITKAVADATRNEQTLAAYQKVIDGLLAGDLSTCYLDGNAFIAGASKTDGDTKSNIYVSGYGKPRSVDATKEVYVPGGVEFELKEGSDVYAMGPGKVLYADNTAFSGKMVVIDHGYGLISRYQGLSEFAVKVGDVVATGDVIAKSGSTGFNKGNALYEELSVYNVPICPYNVWDTTTPIVFE